MSTHQKHRTTTINRDFVLVVGGQILGAQLAGTREPSLTRDDHLDRLADLAVRGALALEAAIPRAEERLAAEAKAAQDAEAAAEKAAADGAAAEKAAAKESAAAAKDVEKSSAHK